MSGDRQLTRVAALPAEYGTTRLHHLFEAGYQRWQVDGDVRPQALIETIEDVGVCAIAGDENNPESLLDIVERLETLAVASSLAGVCLCSLDRFENTRRSSIQPWVVLREQYAESMMGMVMDLDDESLKREIAEVLLGKPQAEHVRHYGGVTVTGIVDDPAGGRGQYLEIPVAAASTSCLVGLSDANEDRSQSETEPTDRRTLVRDNHLLLPASVLTDRYRSYLVERGFPALQDAQAERLTPEERSWLTDEATAIGDGIKRLADQGHRERLWAHVHPGDSLVTALTDAIRATDDDGGPALGEPSTAGELYEALESHTPEKSWVRSIVDRIESSYSLAQRLSRHEDHPRLTLQEGDIQQEYIIAGGGGDDESLHIDHPEDFLQLPCYQALDERLQEKGPTRKELWDLVRKTAWLPQHRSNGAPDVERVLSDIKELFSRWPWYDPRITEQQVRYELRSDAGDRRLDGHEPLPMGCDNPDMQQYCIGKDQCSYSIYGSLPFDDDLYEALDEISDGGD